MASIVVREWKIVLSVLVVCWIVAGTYYLVAPRVYESSALLAAAEAEGSQSILGGLTQGLGGVASLAGLELEDQGPNIDVALAMVTSRGFLEAFIQEENLAPRLFANRWDATAGRWNVGAGRVPTLQEGYIYFSEEILAVSRNRETGLVTLSIRWSVPDEAALWATKLVARLNSTMRLRDSEAARRNLAFLEAEANKATGIEIRESIYSMMEAQLNKAMLASVREDYVFIIVDPPHVSDPDKYVSPRALVAALLATFLGGMVGVGVVYGQLARRAN